MSVFSDLVNLDQLAITVKASVEELPSKEHSRIFPSLGFFG